LPPTPRYRCTLAWGRRGLSEAALRGDIVVIVDVLSFSTCVVTATQHGGVIVPCAEEDDPHALAERHDAVVAVRREQATARDRYSLSPLSFAAVRPGQTVVLPSPNGGACSSLGDGASFLFAGAIVNATAVGHTVTRLVDSSDHTVTIVATGERYGTPSEDGTIRFAVEDYVGAGAILAAIDADKSPEAEVCESAFAQVRHRLGEVLWGCESGLELRERGYKEDVHHASQLDRYSAVPIMLDGRFVRWAPPQRKALAYVTREREGRIELLVFEHADHPESGLQVPAGTLDVGEDPEWGALREVAEETGLRELRVVRQLRTHTLYAPWAGAHHERHIYHLELTGDAPDEWTHIVSAGGEDRGMRFACRWHDIAEPLELAGRQGEYLEYLLASLYS
jgi:2-phosphosulfolactate phosphatase